MKQLLTCIFLTGILMSSCSGLLKNRPIGGSVLDATTGKPLTGITVALYGSYNYTANPKVTGNRVEIARTRTDVHGNFELHPEYIKDFKRFCLKAIPPKGKVDTSETVWQYLYTHNSIVRYNIREFSGSQQINLYPSGIIYFRTRTGALNCDSIRIVSSNQYQTLQNRQYMSTGLFYADPGSPHTFQFWGFTDGRKSLLCKYKLTVKNSHMKSGEYWHDIEDIPLFAAK